MDRCRILEQIIASKEIKELVGFYDRHKSILEPFQHILSNEVELSNDNVNDIFTMPQIDTPFTTIDDAVLEELIEIIQETKLITTKIIHYLVLNHQLCTITNKLMSK